MTAGWDDAYGTDVLADYSRRPTRVELPVVEAVPGEVFEDLTSDFCGSVVAVERGGVELEDRHGRRRLFPLGEGFLYEGRPVRLVLPRAATPARKQSRSGAVASARGRAMVAKASRVFVEGRHDAELIEHVWGDDLRDEGIVVEQLDGADHLDDVLTAFRPGPGRRAGVLLDHLVQGSKETRIADAVTARHGREHVLVLGHPYVDVWQAVKPERLGFERWPVVPRGIPWKAGICMALGFPYDTPADIAQAWRAILRTVRSYADLEPSVLARVEELIDFVTVDRAS